ncbi:hypothetical protein M949_1227 [Riemerella anatipestifer CH3]|nr:hypothetical protein M949_1227 [Riemerella anatipestifer CH3]
MRNRRMGSRNTKTTLRNARIAMRNAKKTGGTQKQPVGIEE